MSINRGGILDLEKKLINDNVVIVEKANLIDLNLGKNNIDKGMQAFRQNASPAKNSMIMEPHNHFNYRAVTDDQLANFWEKVGMSQGEVLRLKDKQLSNEDCWIIGHIAATRLKGLFLDNTIGDGGMQAFASGLHSAVVASESLSQLRILSLENNRIGVGGMQALASASESLPNLTHLWVSINNIGDGGMVAFTTAVSSGPESQLTHLNFEENDIGDDGMIAFAAASKSLTQLQANAARS
jgi:hypothetical protein